MGSKIRCVIRGTEYPSFAAAALLAAVYRPPAKSDG